MQIHKLSTYLLVIFVIVSPTDNAFSQLSERVDTTLVDSVFSKYDSPDSPGCALGVVNKGDIIYSKGYGMANLAYDNPIDDETIFYAGSVSKQFTAASIAILADRGTISLEDSVSKYIPELPGYGDNITIKNLVHHTSGVRDIYGLMSLSGDRVEDVFTYDDALNLISSSKELNFNPGSKYLYSNSGYFILTVIIKRATGQSLREFARKNIFQPLGMHDTHFHDDHTHNIPQLAMSYNPRAKGEFEISYIPNFEQVGQGGLYTTIKDLYKWDQNFYDNKLKSTSFLDIMHTKGVLNNGDTLDYAFGINISKYKGLKTVSHGGSFMGYKAYFLQFPEEEFSVLTLCNRGDINPGSLSRQVSDIFLRDKISSYYESFTGKYTNDWLGVTYEIFQRNGKIYMKNNSNRSSSYNILTAPYGRLTYSEDNTFHIDGRSGTSIVFKSLNDTPHFDINLGRVNNVSFYKSN